MFIKKVLGALLFVVCGASGAFAQGAGFPDRPVRMVVPFAAGGLADITFRLVGEKLSVLLGKQVVIENIPGAGGIAAAQAVLRAKPDGHTLLVIANGTAITKSLFKSLPYDPVKDLAPVSFAAYFDLIVLTKADERYRSLADLLAAARSNPGKLNFGTINPGSTQHLSAELFKTTAGINVAVVPFKTTPEAFSALIAGEIDAVFESYATAKSLIDGGRLRALASSGPKRSPYLPNVPTVQEAGVPGYDVTGWNALSAPAGTPPEVLALLNRHMNTVMAMPDVKKRLLDLGTEAYGGSQEELRNRLNADIAKWAAVIRQAGVPQQ
jgi:tripartite-type tricarboxylate transporter receptor subunit TctC